MANKRDIKRDIKNATDLLIEDAILKSLNSDKKKVESIDKLIDEVIDIRYDLLSKVSNYPNKENRKAIKKHFSAIQESLSKAKTDYASKIAQA